MQPRVQLTMTIQVATGKPHSMQDSVSVLNNDRTLWLPATVVHAADHGSYIVKVIGGAEYRWAWDHIHECHPDAVSPDTLAGQPVTTPSTSEAVQQAPTICCSCNTQECCSPKPYSSNSHPAEGTCNCRCSTTDQQNCCHTSLIWSSVRHHNALLNRCKYNCDDVTGWASAPAHNGSRSKVT